MKIFDDNIILSDWSETLSVKTPESPAEWFIFSLHVRIAADLFSIFLLFDELHTHLDSESSKSLSVFQIISAADHCGGVLVYSYATGRLKEELNRDQPQDVSL